MTTQKKPWPAILMMIALFAMIAFVTNLCSPMAIIVKNQFGASNFLAQVGNLGNFIAYLVMGIPAGILIKKYGYKKTALMALAIGMLGIVVQWMSGWESVGNFMVYLLGAFIAGLCMCMLNTVVNPMLNLLGGGGKEGNQLIQIGGTFNSAAAVAVYILMGALIGSDPEKATISQAEPALFIALGVFAVAFVVLLFTKIQEPRTQVEAHKDKKDKYSAFSFRHFDLGILAIFLYMGVEVGIPTYMLLYLNEVVGMNPATATLLGSIYWLFMMIGRFVGGVVGGKVSSRSMIVTVATAAVALVVFAITCMNLFDVYAPAINWAPFEFRFEQVPVGILALMLVGLCTSVMWGAIFNLATEGLGKYTSIASGAFMTMVFGCAVLIPLEGWLADITGTYMTAFWVVAACAAYILWYGLVGYKNVNRDIPVDDK